MRLIWQWSLFVGAILVIGGTTLGLAFAGSPARLPAGSQIAGVDVSGLTPGAARTMLERRSRELGRTPVVFTAEGKRWRVKPDTVVAEIDWAAAVEAARRQGRGLRAGPGPQSVSASASSAATSRRGRRSTRLRSTRT